MKKREQAVGAGAATTRAANVTFKRLCQSPSRFHSWSGAAAVQADCPLKRLCRSPCGKPLAFRSQVQENRGSASRRRSRVSD